MKFKNKLHVEIGSLGGTPSPRVRGLEEGAPQMCFVGLEPSLGFCTQRCVAKTMKVVIYLTYGDDK